MAPFETPRAMELGEIPALIQDFVHAAQQAKAAGFDGVEVHSANGYLLDQFLQDGSNKRTDNYGGSFANRTRLLLEVLAAVNTVWGSDRVGVRLSPFGTFNDMSDSDTSGLFTYVVGELAKLKPFDSAQFTIQRGLRQLKTNIKLEEFPPQLNRVREGVI
jgi:N-ethylmaleimide reductase